MKKFILTMFFTLLLACSVNADTIVNVPIDSRPISTDYLQNLAEIGRDSYICADKKNMDFFSSYEPDNHLGNSKKVREEVARLVKANNNTHTAVIINTSTYITNGLVGSRCDVNYSDYKTALQDLHDLVSTNINPRYYVNMPMPRALPETRFNKIWCNDDTLHGLGYYYLKHNPNDENYDYISKNFSKVKPEQFLMEYGYVENKALELGGYNKLSAWEREFINTFNSKYNGKDPYKTYIEAYKDTYKSCADIFATLVKYQKQGLIDEIIVSNDDLQLPNFVTYMSRSNPDWIQCYEGSPVKYSFARTYSKITDTSVSGVIKTNYGVDELTNANIGRGKYVNVINGTDEVPQLIYARDYTKRKNVTPKYNVVTNKVSSDVSAYDVKRAGSVTNFAINFASGNVGNYTKTPVDMYIYDYAYGSNTDHILSGINNSLKKNNTALIELFGSKSIASGNYVFQKLLNNNSLSKLCAYSAWNTNGNAIGLGVAQSQVYTVAQEKSLSPRDTAEAQANMLLQHIIEDGVYTSRVKRELSTQGYRPNVEDRISSQMLYDMLDADKYANVIKDSVYTVNGEQYKMNNVSVDSVSFPWGRTFDILVKSSVESTKVK